MKMKTLLKKKGKFNFFKEFEEFLSVLTSHTILITLFNS